MMEKQMIYQNYVKRGLDVALSAAGIVALSPVLISLSVAIKTDSKGPVLFKQRRIGKNKNEFNILKYRSMSIDTPKDIPTHKLANPDQFITKMGRFLRKTSLDELPQLFNILVGDMSVVGPRPALWNQVDLIAERDKYGVNDVRPGLTGLAQINGRDELEIPVKVAFDRQYVENITFANDAKIVLETILSVLRNEGVQEGGTGAMGIEEELI
jgi:O-antigen biosynthesis protein WbqP